MKTEELKFDGTTYRCRVVKSNENEELLIASTALTRTKALLVKKPKGSTTRCSISPMRKTLNSLTTN